MSGNAKKEKELKLAGVGADAQLDISPETIVFKTAPIHFNRRKNGAIMLDFEKQMGFRPKRIFIKMDASRNNTVVVGIIDDDRESQFAKDIDAKKPK